MAVASVPCPTHRRVAGPLLMSFMLLAGCTAFVPQAGPEHEPPGRYDDLTLPIVAVGSAWAMQKDKVTIKPRVDEDTLAMNIKPK